MDQSGPFPFSQPGNHRPSTPPAELQLTALDSSSVLVSWHPPLEPNGIIVEYKIQYFEDSGQPDNRWTTISQDGTTISTEVRGLRSATRYLFKMRACTEVGAGPFTPIKEVHTPLEREELDVSTETGVIMGVCLGILCIFLCMCLSLRSSKTRKVPGGLDSSTMTFQYHLSQSVAPQTSTRVGHQELETLITSQEKNQAASNGENPEEQSLMSTGGDADNLDLEHKWDRKQELYSSFSSKHIDAEVVVHSESSDCKERWQEECEDKHSQNCPWTCLRNGNPPTQPCTRGHNADFQEGPQSPSSAQSDPCLEVMNEYNKHQEEGTSQVCMDRWSPVAFQHVGNQELSAEWECTLPPQKGPISNIQLSTCPVLLGTT
ncbi:immunoglobulin superfamily DCC subclass member 4-like [Arapaima gigas]